MESISLENPLLQVRECTLACVEFPGLVQNKDRMMEMIGGDSAVSQVFSSTTKRLELKWRPDEVYCKPAYGDRMPATGMLLKVIRRKRVRADGTVYSTMHAELAGPVLSMYKFNGMADYQYLPMSRQGSQYTSLRKDLIISKLEDSSWISQDAPLFLMPVYFSRIDQPVSYAYRKEPTLRKPSSLPQNLLGISRERRLHHTIAHSYGDTVPQAPLPEAWNNLSAKEVEHGRIDELKKLFEERPIWSRNAILLRYTGCPNKLKFLLPVIAYYCTSGPWRTMWIRYGFDPRSDAGAKIYQTLDYRIRQRAGERLAVSNAKRSPYFYAVPTKTSKRALAARTSHFKLGKEPSQDDGKNTEDSASVFRPGRLPPYRQMFYQVCDVLCDQVQALVHQNDGQETECSEKDGWCAPDTIAKCRAIIGQHVEKLRAKTPMLKFFENSKHSSKRRAIDAKRNQRKRKKTKLFDDHSSEDETEPASVEHAEEALEDENVMTQELLDNLTGVDAEGEDDNGDTMTST